MKSNKLFTNVASCLFCTRLSAFILSGPKLSQSKPTNFGISPSRSSAHFHTSQSLKSLIDDEISPRIASIAPSKTIEVHALTKEMEARGESVVSLCVGEPDFQPPPAVIEATAEAARLGQTKYTGVTGSNNLREAISADLLRRKNVAYSPTEIVVSNGAKQSVYQAVLSVVRDGDEVIIPAPYWPSYPEIVRMAGGTPIIVHTDVSEGFLMSPQALREAISIKTRMLIFCNPSNPTGAVYSKQQCQELANVLMEERNSKIWILADEIYERIIYDLPHYSFPAIPGMKKRTMLVNGFSKSHAMTGYRIGYLAAPPSIVKAVTTIQGQLTSCASSISQAAAFAALSVPDHIMQQSFDQMRQKRDYVLGRLEEIPHIKVAKPEGAFYVLPDISYYYGMSASDGTLIDGPTTLCLYLLRVHKVAFVTGEGFGYFDGVRLSYATSMEDLSYALDQFKACLQSLK